jgi:hypothetical protein
MNSDIKDVADLWNSSQRWDEFWNWLCDIGTVDIPTTIDIWTTGF